MSLLLHILMDKQFLSLTNLDLYIFFWVLCRLRAEYFFWFASTTSWSYAKMGLELELWNVCERKMGWDSV